MASLNVAFTAVAVLTPVAFAEGTTLTTVGSVVSASGVTVSVAAAVAWPAALVAVTVYVVVAAGETLCVPDSATMPIPWSMLTLVAFVAVQLRAADWPLAIVPGETLNVTEGK